MVFRCMGRWTIRCLRRELVSQSYDSAISGTSTIDVINSTIKGYWQGIAIPYTADGRTVVSAATPNNAAYFAGTSSRDHLVGGPGTNKIVGGGGADTMTGGAGKDIFVCSPYGALSVLPDFMQGQDKVSTAYWHVDPGDIQNRAAAVGTESCMLFNPNNKTLYYDPDGGGRQLPSQIAYLPYVATMKASDFDWV